MLRIALSRACWADGDGDAAAALVAPLTEDDGLVPQLTELLARWRVERPEAGRIALLQAELLGRAGKGSQAVQAILEVGDGLAPAEAGPALERILTRSPKEARAWRLLAEVRRADGDLDGAVEAIDRLAHEAPERADEGAEVLRAVLAVNPSHGPAHRLLAGMLLGRGEVEAAVTLLRHRLLLDPGDAVQLAGELEALGGEHPAATSIELGAAEAWMAAGQPAQAIAHLASAASAGSAFAAQVAHRLSQVVHQEPSLAADVEPVIGMLEGAMADPAAIPFLRAEVAAAAGDPDGAAARASECYGVGGRRAVRPVAALLEGLLRQHPGASGPRMMLANLLADHGQVVRAVAVVAEARDPDPGAVSALLRKVESLPAERRDPGTRCALARLLLFAGRPDEALAAAEAVLRDAGARAPAELHLVRAAALLARREPEAAIASVRQACRRDPALLPRGIEILEARLEAEPEDALACRAVGALRLAAGQVLEGLSLLRDLADGHPEHVEGVLREIEALGDRFREDPRLPLTAARLQALAGRPEQAWETLGEAREAGATATQIEELAGEWLEHAAGDPGVLLLVARCRAAEDPASASELLERVASAAPDRAEEAVELLEQIAGAHPESPEPRCAAGRIRLAGGDPARAFAVARPAFRGPMSDDAVSLLERIRAAWPDGEEPARVLARLLLATGRPAEALPEIEAARSAGAPSEELLPLLDDLVDAAGSTAALLTRSAVRAETGDLDGAVADLETAVADGAEAAVRGGVETILEARPDHLPARRLHVRLLRDAGDEDAARRSLDLGLEHVADRADRCELLLERSDLLRASGRGHEAARDLRDAEELAEDRGAFLARVHRGYLRRLRQQLPRVPPSARVRMLLDLGRVEEAAGVLAAGGMDPGAARALRAELLLARGETAPGLLLLRSERPSTALVDGAQRCDQPGLALAAVERLLESGDDASLHRARSRLVQDVWRREVRDRRVALVGRLPFVPREEEAG
jgi:tetratricopeptide (TPR) repeat protein